LCEECKKEGRLVPAQEVHHKIALADGGTHAESNLVSLCAACHSRVTAREGGRWGKRS
jgi:5-methylcytosine-specific restriction protein A